MSANNNRGGKHCVHGVSPQGFCQLCAAARPERRAAAIAEAPEPARTLRDEFAMAALVNCSDHMGCPRDMADAAYEIADAMLAAREIKP